ncbi:MAG TPA: ATP-binding protein, partial [Pseudolabrys sp.]|nr:ATP-binding protein [Pseudolabrys sp.]
LGQLTGGLAHDFNNLLTVLAGNLALIHAKTDQEEIKRLADNALKGTERSSRLIESLLAFARKKPLNRERVNPNELIDEFMPMLEGAAGSDVDIVLDLDAAIKPCLIDPPQFQSALLNLVSNARSAMPDGGRIDITSTMPNELPRVEPPLEGDYVCISISDTGSGMPLQVAARVFDPFFTTKEEGKGTGLGLSQVYGFAKHSEGHVDLTSEPGAGTTIRIWLPCHSSE